jgi:hypothetical protein
LATLPALFGLSGIDLPTTLFETPSTFFLCFALLSLQAFVV